MGIRRAKVKIVLYRRAVIQELVVTMLTVFAVLLAITLVTVWVRFLNQAAAGTLAPEAVLAFLGFATIGAMPVLLTVTLFIASLLTLSRMSRDNEMVIWQTAGIALTGWVRPLMLVAVPVILFIAAITLVVSPWSLAKSAEYRRELERREDIALVTPGVFRESKHTDRVFFVESLGSDGAVVNNVFVRSEQHGRLGVMSATRGAQFVAPNGDRYLVLEAGRRYDGVPGQADYRTMAFERYAVRIEPYEVRAGPPALKATPTHVLLAAPTREHWGELMWRLSMPVSAALLVLLSLPLSLVNPRSGRSFHLIAALLIYAIYSNLLSVAHAWVLQGKTSPWLGVWSVHLLMAVVTVAALYGRQAGIPAWLRRQR